MADRVTDGLGDMVRSVLLFLPKALAFVAILVVGWLVAKAVHKIVNKVLERVGFDRVVERGGVKKALARSEVDASDIVAKLASYGVLLLALQLAFGIWSPNPISALINAVMAWLPKAFVAIVIVVVAAAIARGVKDLISSALGGLSYGALLANLASVFILGLGIIAALNQIGVATAVTTPVLIAVLATIAGVIIVGVGGGLIKPMQSRWDGWLHRAETEAQVIAEHGRAYRAGLEDAARADAAKADAARVDAAQVDAASIGASTQPAAPVADTVVVSDLAADDPANAPRATTYQGTGVADQPTMVIPATETQRIR